MWNETDFTGEVWKDTLTRVLVRYLDHGLTKTSWHETSGQATLLPRMKKNEGVQKVCFIT